MQVSEQCRLGGFALSAQAAQKRANSPRGTGGGEPAPESLRDRLCLECPPQTLLPKPNPDAKVCKLH